MSVSDEQIQEFKEIMEKKEGREVSWEEASEGAHHLAAFVKLLYDCWVEDQRRERKLRENPKGYALDGAYSCAICGNGTQHDGNWFDRWGIKCMICQRAVERGEVPGWAAKHRDGWYSKYDLESRFKMKTPILKKWIKEGIIKPCTITRNGEGVHTQIFLLRDNKGFLPPKKLTESQLVGEERDGKRWHHSEPWYRFVDPFEHLKGYKIMDHMRLVPAEPKEA